MPSTVSDFGQYAGSIGWLNPLYEYYRIDHGSRIVIAGTTVHSVETLGFSGWHTKEKL